MTIATVAVGITNEYSEQHYLEDGHGDDDDEDGGDDDGCSSYISVVTLSLQVVVAMIVRSALADPPGDSCPRRRCQSRRGRKPAVGGRQGRYPGLGVFFLGSTRRLIRVTIRLRGLQKRFGV